MMCDGGDECLRFLRFWDGDMYDPATIGKLIRAFLSKLSFLFIKGKCLTLGCTRRMLTLLGRVRVLTLPGMDALTIGASDGIPAATVKACMDTMQAWLVLVVGGLQAEFPSWEILQSMQVFDITSQGANTADLLTRIANTFHLDAAALIKQYARAVPTAHSALKTRAAESNFEAWRVALAHDNDTAELRNALVRYGVFIGCSTSGVERSHHDANWPLTLFMVLSV